MNTMSQQYCICCKLPEQEYNAMALLAMGPKYRGMEGEGLPKCIADTDDPKLDSVPDVWSACYLWPIVALFNARTGRMLKELKIWYQAHPQTLPPMYDLAHERVIGYMTNKMDDMLRTSWYAYMRGIRENHGKGVANEDPDAREEEFPGNC